MLVNKTEKGFIYKAENWAEQFRIYITGTLVRSKREGDMMPRFYLPVWRSVERDELECWIFPLAPVVLFWRITQQVFYTIWKDLLEFLYMLYEWNRTHTR